jgi:hypothetical protein
MIREAEKQKAELCWVTICYLQLALIKFVKRGETMIDVGAHRGEFALAASKVVGSHGKVICF